MATAMEASGGAKTPELLSSLEEIQKAVDTVQQTTLSICEWLRIGIDRPITESKSPEPQPALIVERIRHLGSLRQSLYETNARLEEIMAAVREI